MSGRRGGSGRDPIAIVGVGCRLPGAASPAEFWRLLVDGAQAVGEIPRDRFDVDALFDERPATPGRIMTRWGGFLTDIDRFDAQFFGLSPREADRLDPQQRLLLEVGWEALEDAGQSLERVDRAHTSVFIGTWLNDYETRLTRNPRAIDFYTTTGTGRYSASGRLSYVFGFEGPSVTIDCACSSSLVAIHLACQSLWSGESSLALAGGANVILEPYIHIAYSQSRMMAPDGRCKFGDASADGYVRSEGAAIVVLKPLAQALADGDPVYATIIGSAVNNGGRSSGFLATPGQAGQETMLRRAYEDAGVASTAVQYVEAHGTGTRVGDPVEVGAIGAVLGSGRPADAPCLVGSVKTNIGHTEGAAGVAGVIKVALALKHGLIPASLHCEQPNPDIPWGDNGVQVTRRAQPWAAGRPAIAGVSSFGISGTNAHIVLQQAAPRVTQPSSTAAAPYLVALSAQSDAALRAQAASWAAWLAAAPAEITPADVAYTAAVRRTPQDRRAMAVAASREDLLQQLEACAHGTAHAALVAGTSVADRRHKTAFVFPGQGSQWLGMGRRLLAEQPAFRAALQACDAAIQDETGWSVLEQLAADASTSRLTEIDVIQPVLFSVQVGLAALWREWGVVPDAVVGHSMGEVAAACVAGAISLEDAARVICRRSRLLKRTSGKGAMAVIGLSFDAAAAAISGLEDRLSIAVSNSSRSTVISGDPDAIDTVIETLERRDVFCRRVKVDVASHSPQMDPLQDELFAALGDVRPRAGHVPVCSTVLAETVDGASFDAGYWVRNLRQPVLFSRAVQQLIADGYDTFVEMSPHPLLASSVQELLQEAGAEGVVAGSLTRDVDEMQAIGRSAAVLWTAGRPVRLERLCPPGRVAALPTYPFQRERHWLDVAVAHGTAAARRGDSLLGSRLPSPVPSFELEASLDTDEWLTGVRYDGAALIAPATLMAMAAAAARQQSGGAAITLTAMAFDEPAVVPAAGTLTLQTVLPRVMREGGSFSIHWRTDADPAAWTRCAAGDFRAAGPQQRAIAVDALRTEGTRADGASFYRALSARGIEVRVDRQVLLDVRTSGAGRLARLNPAATGDQRLAQVFEACLHLLAAGADDAPATIRVPAAIGALRLSPAAAAAAELLVTAAADGLHGSCVLLDAAGQVCGEIEEIALKRVRTAVFAGTVRARTAGWMYDLTWEPVTLAAADAARLARGFVVLGADSPLGAAVADAIDAGGGTAVRVVAGASFAALPGGAFAIDPASAADYVRVLTETSGTLSRPLAGFVQIVAGAARQAEALTSLMAVRALDAAGVAGAAWFVTAGAQAIGDGDVPELSQAPVWGVARALALEQPRLFGGVVDVDPRAPAAVSAEAVMEFLGAGSERQLARRDGEWRAPRLLPAATAAVSRIPLARDAAYVVTGGLGRLGLQVARWLAENGAGHIVLVGRRGLPPREQWADLAERSEAARQVRGVLAVERLGAHVTVAAADASDAAAMRELFSRFGASLPPLRGIVHAAGRIDYRPIDQVGATELADVSRAKVDGTRVLDELTRDGRHALDFFVMFSSGASVWGSRHLAHYSAANHVLDAVAHARRAAGFPATAINWGWWEGGATTADAEALFAQAGLQVMAADDALEAMADVIAAGVPQRIVAAIDWQVFKPAIESTGSTLLSRIGVMADTQKAARPRGTLSRELAALPAAESRARILEYVRAEVGAVIGRDPALLDLTRGLFKLGMDSMMTVELRRRLEAALDRTLPATIAFEYPNIAALAAFLAGQVVPSERPSETAAEPETVAAALDAESDEALALMLDSELDRLLTEEERTN